MKRSLTVLTFLVAAVPTLAAAQSNPAFAGYWETDTEKSSALDPWRRIDMEISVAGDSVTIIRHYDAGKRKATETMALDTSLPTQVVATEGWWDNRHIGAYLGNDNRQTVAPKWVDGGQTLQLGIDLVLETSQGETPVRVYRELRLSDDGQRLTDLQLRSSRNLPVVRVYRKSES
jgi:hypothetical protein